MLTTGSDSEATGSVSGACSTTTWALVPLTPNDDTPARRARPTDGHSMGCAAMVNRDAPVTGVRSQLIEVQMLGNVPVVHTEHGLDETGDSGRRLQMTQIRFHRTQHQRRGAIALGEDLAQRVEFDRITQRGAGAVGLDVVDLGRRQPRGRQRLAQ